MRNIQLLHLKKKLNTLLWNECLLVWKISTDSLGNSNIKDVAPEKIFTVLYILCWYQ